MNWSSSPECVKWSLGLSSHCDTVANHSGRAGGCSVLVVQPVDGGTGYGGVPHRGEPAAAPGLHRHARHLPAHLTRIRHTDSQVGILRNL